MAKLKHVSLTCVVLYYCLYYSYQIATFCNHISNFVNNKIEVTDALILYIIIRTTIISMMINNNPYNLPERPPNKQNRIYTESGVNQFRGQLVQNSLPYPQYVNRPVPTNLMQKKNSITVQETNSSYRQPYNTVRNQIKHFLPSPKNQNSSSQNINNFNTLPNNRGNLNIGSSLDKKQPGHSSSLRQSFGSPVVQPNFDMKQLNQRIETISHNMRIHEKRILDLQKNGSIGFLPNNSKLVNQTELPYYITPQIQSILSKHQSQWLDNIHKLKQQIQRIKEQVKVSNNKNYEINKNVNDQIKQLMEVSKSNQSLSSSQKLCADELKKDSEVLRIQLQQKIKKNYDFLTSVIGRVQRQFHNGIINIQPNFKPSAIKCSSTAILLRFVECFKVRKHSAKNGEIKITLTDNTYYIDSEGYLLDKEQYYLVDGRGNRVKLQEKHIKLLKQQSILS